MDDRVYESLIMRYAPSWNAPRQPPRPGTDRGAAAVDADGQADQCRIPDRGLDPAGQHHDAGAGASAAGADAAAGSRRHASAGRAFGRGTVATRTGSDRHAGAGRRQEAAAGAEAAGAATAPVQLSPGTGASTARHQTTNDLFKARAAR